MNCWNQCQGLTMQSNDIEIIRSDVNSSASSEEILDVFLKNVSGVSRVGKTEIHRNGSKNRVAGGVTNVGMPFLYLKLFSDEIKMPYKKNPAVWTYFDLLLHLKFNGNFKELMNYLGYGYSNNGNTSIKAQKQATNKPQPKTIVTTPQPTKTALIGSNDVRYRFERELLEHIVAEREILARMSRNESHESVIQENPTAKFDRLYRICVNRFFQNKNADKQYLSHSYIDKNGIEKNIFKMFSGEFSEFEVLNTFWTNEQVTIQELIEIIQSGYAWLPSQMKDESFVYRGETYTYAYRQLSNFRGSEIFSIDVDGGLNLDECWNLPFTKERCMFSYTSASHTPENHRFRLVFGLPYFVTDSNIYTSFVKRTIEYYQKFTGNNTGIDTKTTEPHRVWYGSSNSQIKTNNKFRND